MADPGDGGSDGVTSHPSPYGSPPGSQPRTVSPYLAQPPSTGPYAQAGRPQAYLPTGYPPVGYPPTEYEEYTPSPQPPPPPADGSRPPDPFPGREAPVPREKPEPRGLRKLLHLVSLPVLATILLAWALTTLVGDVRWGPFSIVPPLLSCLTPSLVVVALPVVAMAVRRHNWTALVPALAALGLPWTFMIGYVVPADPPAGRLIPLRALLVTARNGVADPQDVAVAARTRRADLVVVTELSSSLAHQLTKAGLARSLSPRYVSVPEDGQSPAAGLAIYSRFTVDQVQQLPGTHWPAVRARVMVGQTPVTLVTGHAVQPSTDHLDRWRRDLQAFGAAAKISGPVLVLANLNATPWQPQFRAIVSGRLHDAADVLGCGLRPTWPNFSPLPLLPTDHALVAAAGVSSLGTVPITGTDHRALSVELTIPQTPSSGAGPG